MIFSPNDDWACYLLSLLRMRGFWCVILYNRPIVITLFFFFFVVLLIGLFAICKSFKYEDFLKCL